MYFQDLIQQIMDARNADEFEIARELQITPLQIQNLRDGKSKLPNSKNCKKILRYCVKYGIDYDYIDWNDIAYTLFLENGWASDYIWMSDLDGDSFISLKHTECGKVTKVPFAAFNTRSTPCIHCWAKKFIPPDSYAYELSEDTPIHKFTHSCGHTYKVSYAQIKQKRFKCPNCGAKFRADASAINNRRDYSFINHPRLPEYWLDLDYMGEYFMERTNRRSIVWIQADIATSYAEQIVVNIINKQDASLDDIDTVEVFHSTFDLEDYLLYVKAEQDETIVVDFERVS